MNSQNSEREREFGIKLMILRDKERESSEIRNERMNNRLPFFQAGGTYS